jgi:hypothetical protein
MKVYPLRIVSSDTFAALAATLHMTGESAWRLQLPCVNKGKRCT